MASGHKLGLAVVCLAAITACVTTAPPVNRTPSAPSPPVDFDGDGFGDLVVGASEATVSGNKSAGAVGVIRGGADGLDIRTAQRLDKSLAWIPGDPRTNDHFGSSAAAGDINGDRYSDLAICTSEGSPTGEDRRLTIALGSADGPRRAFTLDLPFCGALGFADLDRDGFADLYTEGVPAQVAYGGPEAGAADGIRFHPIDGLTYGFAAFGDVDGNGYPDLAYINPTEADTRLKLFLGGASGLPAKPSLNRLVPHEVPYDEANDVSVAVGDLDGDGRAEVVIGEENSQVGKAFNAGRVLVFKGGPHGITPSDIPEFIDQDTPGIPGTAAAGNYFGGEVAIGDANGDGVGDLAVGVPTETIGTAKGAGIVTVIPGTRRGLDLGASQDISRNTPGVPGTPEQLDFFGTPIVFRDLDADNRMELIASSTRTDHHPVVFHVLKGSADGITGSGSKSYRPVQFGADVGNKEFWIDLY